VVEELRESVSTFLSANPEMRLKEGSILALLASNDVKLGELTQDEVKVITPELMKIERMARLTPSLEYVGPLISSGYVSARDVVIKHSRDVFIEEIGPVIANETEAGQIYDAAAGAVATTEALVLAYSPRFGGIDLPVIPSNDIPKSGTMALRSHTRNRSLINSANLQRLFGSQDYPECAHGASLYGPAAYLADLLQMLARGPKVNHKTALQILLERRPDLAEIDLTADNAEITLPYVDLVLEILEAPADLTTPRFPRGVGHVNGFDGILSSGTVPEAMKNGERSLALLGIKLGEDEDLNVHGPTDGPWRIRDKSSGAKYRLNHNSSDMRYYDLDIFPQSVAGTARGYRPWSSLLSTVIRNVGTSTFPWKLPFDIVRMKLTPGSNISVLPGSR